MKTLPPSILHSLAGVFTLLAQYCRTLAAEAEQSPRTRESDIESQDDPRSGRSCCSSTAEAGKPTRTSPQLEFVSQVIPANDSSGSCRSCRRPAVCFKGVTGGHCLFHCTRSCGNTGPDYVRRS